ncbi:MAG: AAA family ATPase [Lachnospiraceae bacterium]|nr:AAA family ATPase [Clostridiales bacterium]MDY2608074.1 AAA family ATPase [Lachnospiraceae bacterium]
MNSIKVLHTGDVHLGYDCEKDDIEKSFARIISICEDENVDVMLIAGDLFDNAGPDDELVDWVIDRFMQINRTMIMISPGNHDYYIRGGCYDRINTACENVFIFDGEMDYYEINIGNAVARIYGAGFTDSICMNSLMKQRNIIDDDAINLGVFHGTVEGQQSKNPYNPISLKQIEDNEFDYLALGHIHKQTEVLHRGYSTYAYCGCPQGMSFGMKGAKGIYLGIVGQGYANMKFVEVCERRYEEIKIKLDAKSQAGNAVKIAAAIERLAMENLGEKYRDNLYRIILTGKVSGRINTNAIKRELSELYYVEIEDNCVENAEEVPKEKGITNRFAIRSIHIGNFGGLRNFNMEFQSGFNIIYGKNEFGKSTIMAFIKMMLYGCNSKSKDISQNLRRKYQPFDGSQMCGNMRFVVGDSEYLLEKEFGKTPAFDVRHIYNEVGREIEVPKEYEVGEYFLGLKVYEFEKIIFAGSDRDYLKGEVSNDIFERITNVAAGFDEDDNSIDDLERIEKEMEKLKSKRGTSGEIIEVTKEIDDISEEIERLKEERDNLRNQRTEENSMLVRERDILEGVIEDLENLDEERKEDDEWRKKNRGRGQRALNKTDAIENKVRFKKARNWYYISIIAIIILGIGGIYGVNNFMDKGFFKGYLLAIGVLMIFFVVKLSISRQKMRDNMPQSKWKETDENDIEDDIYEDNRYEDDGYEREYDRINAVLDKLGYNGYSIRELKSELREINRRLGTGTSSAQDKISARIEKYEDMLKAAGSRKVKLNNEYKCLADKREEALKRTRKLKDAASMPLNGRMVELMNEMCGKEYDSIILGEKGGLKVRESGETNYHEWKYLSSATAMQVYLALRLSLCEAIGNGELKLPILLDDILDVCDDERIDRTVEVLRGLDTQVIMFTCHRWITKK